MSTPGELPRGWRTATLSELGIWSGGGTPSKQKPSYWEGGTIPWVSPKDMGPRRLQGARDHITEPATRESSARIVPADSIAFVVRSGILSRTLPVALVPFAAAYNQDMRVLTPTPSLNVDWLLWSLIATAEDIRIGCQKQGTTVASIDVARLQAFRIAVPPPAEQSRIVERVQSYMSEIDSGLSHLKRAVGQLATFRQSVLQEFLSGTGGTAGADGSLPALSEGWAWSTVEQEGEVQLGRMLNQERATGPNMRPYLRVANVLDNRLELSDVKWMDFPQSEYERYRLEPGDILLNEGQSPELLGRAAMYHGEVEGLCFQKTLLRYRVGPRLNADFALLVFRHYLYSGRFRRESRITTGIGHLTAVRFAAMELPVPPLDLQVRVVREVTPQLEAADKLDADLAVALSEVDSLRRSVLRDLSVGRLTERAPSEESADDLLERVTRERNSAETARRGSPARRRPVQVAE
jgi:type I restriction enzyme S subunit